VAGAVDINPRAMKNCMLKHAHKYKELYANTNRGWEKVIEVRPWGPDYQVTTDLRYFVESYKYVLYRPTADQRRAIERKRKHDD